MPTALSHYKHSAGDYDFRRRTLPPRGPRRDSLAWHKHPVRCLNNPASAMTFNYPSGLRAEKARTRGNEPLSGERTPGEGVEAERAVLQKFPLFVERNESNGWN